MIFNSDLSSEYPTIGQLGMHAEQTFDALFLHDFEERFTDVSEHACEMLGYTREELLHMSVFDISVDHDLISAQALWRSIEPGKSITINSHERRKDGSIFPVRARMSGYRTSHQSFFYLWSATSPSSNGSRSLHAHPRIDIVSFWTLSMKVFA